MIIYSIYKATNNVNGKIYIGQSKDFLKRKDAHERKSLINKDNMSFHHAIRKYGKENFSWEILYQTKDENYYGIAEQYFIDFYETKNKDFGYNMSNGGKSNMLGYKHSKETREKLSKLRKGKMSKEHREKINQSLKGRKFSEAGKKALSLAHMGKKQSQETINKRKETIKRNKLLKNSSL